MEFGGPRADGANGKDNEQGRFHVLPDTDAWIPPIVRATICV
jgi:hypothetical protein